MVTFIQRWAQSLARHFHQAKSTDLADLNPGAIDAQRFAQAVFDLPLAFRVLHINEVNHDQTAQITQSHLAGNLVSGLQVSPERRLLNIRAFGGASRIDVNGHQGFGVVDHDGTARRQGDEAGVSGFDLMFDLKA